MEHDTVNYNNESAAQKGVFGLHGGSRRIKASARQEGIVLHWNPSAGSGAVVADSGRAYLCDVGSLPPGLARVENGARVEIVVDDATMTAEILGIVQ
jgi:hypothetical protein